MEPAAEAQCAELKPQQLPLDVNSVAEIGETVRSLSSHSSANDTYFKPLCQYLAFLRRNALVDDLRSSVLYQVHEDLRLIRKWTNVTVVKSPTRNYLSACAAAEFDSVFPARANQAATVDRTQIVIPLPTSDYLSPRRLKTLCRQCVHPQTLQKLRCVTVAIVDCDSTTAYYRVFDDWDEIVHRQWKQKDAQSKTEHNTNGTTGAGAASRKFNNDDDSSAGCDVSDSE